MPQVDTAAGDVAGVYLDSTWHQMLVLVLVLALALALALAVAVAVAVVVMVVVVAGVVVGWLLLLCLVFCC